MVVLKFEGKMTEESVVVTIFSNDENARPPTLLKIEPAKDI